LKNPKYEAVKRQLNQRPITWLVTGCAGFIGSHLVENLLKLNQKVVGLDNFATGSQKNLIVVKKIVGPKLWEHFRFIRGDITKLSDCYRALGLRPPSSGVCPRRKKNGLSKSKVEIVLHQAGLGSVPRSIADPLATHATNVTGTLNMLVAARNTGVKRFIYAASSSTYGDSRKLPKYENEIGEALSPYAVSKHADELYAKVFGRCYGMETIGLRYFNVFGPRQDPAGAYAAVIPRWIGEIVERKRNVIYGDGRTSRDFCFVENVVQANFLAGVTKNRAASNQVYNIACGEATSLKHLHSMISKAFRKVGSGQWAVGSKRDRARQTAHRSPLKVAPPRFLSERQGDVRHSLASIGKARRLLGFQPTIKIREGIGVTVEEFIGS
jgi:UDP-N-acetylglucosamine 4-epimerase